MNCRFCGAASREDYSLECGSGPNPNQRSQSCWQREVGSLRIRVDYLHDLLAEWRDYADGLEDVGNEMKEGATTPDQVAWDRQIKRRPSQ
jgi:hypothetical protein